MKEKLTDKLSNMGVDFLNWSKDSILKMIKLLESEIPKFIQEYLMYHLIDSIVLIIVGASLLVIAYFLYKKTQDEDSVFNISNFDKIPPPLLAIIGIIFFTITGSLMVIINTKEALTITLAPRIFLLKKATDYAACMKALQPKCTLF